MRSMATIRDLLHCGYAPRLLGIPGWWSLMLRLFWCCWIILNKSRDQKKWSQYHFPGRHIPRTSWSPNHNPWPITPQPRGYSTTLPDTVAHHAAPTGHRGPCVTNPVASCHTWFHSTTRGLLCHTPGWQTKFRDSWGRSLCVPFFNYKFYNWVIS